MDFKLSEAFLVPYKTAIPDWGPLGEFVYLRTYSRRIDSENRNEHWWETVQRVVEGVFTFQKEHCRNLNLPWKNEKSQKSAQSMYDKIFTFKFLPSGRNLWMMGTDFVKEKGGTALLNCSFVSTEDIKEQGANIFSSMMDLLMLGVGAGFDTKGAGKLTIKEPKLDGIYAIPDSREGWVESVRLLLDAYFSGKGLPIFDYSLIRPAGAYIRGFGGTASGFAPLKQLHESLQTLLEGCIGKELSSVDIVDIENFISVCVIAGNVRRCLPKGALVHTDTGMIPIEKVSLNTKVLTHDGYKEVSQVFKQGVQKTIVIKTQDGNFECTPNHRMAMMTGVDTFEWKEAQFLLPGDRLASPATQTGDKSIMPSLPSYSYDKPEHSTTCRDIIIPTFDDDIAWFLGTLHANGYVYYRADRNGANSYISFVFALDKLPLAERIQRIFSRFGVEPILKKRKGENSYIVQVQSKQLASYLHQHFKQSNTLLRVPDLIWTAPISARLAYVAGVMDSDGCVSNKPVKVLTTVYEEFAEDIQNLLYSCGVMSRLDYSLTNNLNRAKKGWKPLFGLSLIGQAGIDMVRSNPNFMRKPKPRIGSKRGNTFPIEWIVSEKVGGALNKKLGVYSAKHLSIETFERHIRPIKYVPIEVIGLQEGREVETFDIEVTDNHSFFCNGYLVHNSAAVAIGEANDEAYVTMKDYNLYPEELKSRRWGSNNSVFAEVGKTDYSALVDSIALNGEPGIVWLENMQKYSRTADPIDWKDYDAKGTNACGEITLQSKEFCNLVETFPSRHETLEEYKSTLKMAYLYGKTVTLIPTHLADWNAVMLKNRRIGVSQSGIIDAFGKHGRREMLRWCDEGYKYIQQLDKIYSDWLCIPRSRKMTTVKPSGSVSLLPGVSAGIHYPHAEYYIRRVRVSKNHPIVLIMKVAGYEIEEDVHESQTVIVSFPVHEKFFVKRKEDVTIWEQCKNVVDLQRFWADNNVSVTVTFKKEERQDIVRVLEAYEDSLKTISFLPLSDHGYEQAPYEQISKERYEHMVAAITVPDFSLITTTPEGSKFCDGESCEIR